MHFDENDHHRAVATPATRCPAGAAAVRGENDNGPSELICGAGPALGSRQVCTVSALRCACAKKANMLLVVPPTPGSRRYPKSHVRLEVYERSLSLPRRCF